MQPSRRQTLGRLAVGLEDIKPIKEKLICIKLKTKFSSKLRKNWRCMVLGILWHFDEKRQSV